MNYVVILKGTERLTGKVRTPYIDIIDEPITSGKDLYKIIIESYSKFPDLEELHVLQVLPMPKGETSEDV